MPERTPQTPGQSIAMRLRNAVARLRSAGRHTARALIRGITPKGIFTNSVDEVLQDIRDKLVASQVVYRRGQDLVVEGNGPDGKVLVLFAEGQTPRSGADAILASVVMCESIGDDGGDPIQFLPPSALVRLLVNDDQLRRKLPAIERYALRPMLSRDYRLLGPGYHPEEKTLVHGPEIEPFLTFTSPTEGPLIERLPPRLRYLIQHLPLAGEPDLANAVGIMITAIMPEHFTESGRPLAVVDGNQPSLGKTSIIRETGIIADGESPPEMTFNINDEELEKGIASRFRDTESSMILIDNVRAASNRPIESAVLERLLTAERIQSRILGHTHVLDAPNDRLWALTCNGGQLGKDILSRSVVIRFRYDGDPDVRELPGDMIAWTRKHRLELLAELFGMVQRWVDAGRPQVDINHRFRVWSATIGGILDANGLGGHFLANRAEVIEEFDVSADELRSLAETVLGTTSGAIGIEACRPAKDWAGWFHSAGVAIDGLSGSHPNRSVMTKIGHWLSSRMGQAVVILGPDGGDATLTLRRTDGRSNTKLYYFDVSESATPEITSTATAAQHQDRDLCRPEAASPATSGNAIEWGARPVVNLPSWRFTTRSTAIK